ncbi:hypothetical protein ACFQ0Q_13675 [Streptomyces aureus]
MQLCCSLAPGLVSYAADRSVRLRCSPAPGLVPYAADRSVGLRHP